MRKKIKMWKFVLLIFLILNSTASADEVGSNTSTINDETSINSTNAHSGVPQSLNFEKSNLLFLSEMPLEQLLKVKKSIEEIQQVGLNYNRNHASETVTTAGTTLESRIINEEPSSNFELGHHGEVVKSSAMPLININQQAQQPQQSTLNRLN